MSEKTKCPNCKSTTYKTTSSGEYGNVIVFHFRCKKCGKYWRSTSLVKSNG